MVGPRATVAHRDGDVRIPRPNTPRLLSWLVMTVSRLRPYATTIFAEMSALASRIGAVNLGQGFPDEDGPPAMLEAARSAIADGVN
ncbi:MAG: hypothetical protein M3Y83_01780, partial [Actinomycetota bacterium]|nr:hypothetical protein [Actinomycetota bacterium]